MLSNAPRLQVLEVLRTARYPVCHLSENWPTVTHCEWTEWHRHQMCQGMAGSEMEPDRGWEHVMKGATKEPFETY